MDTLTTERILPPQQAQAERSGEDRMIEEKTPSSPALPTQRTLTLEECLQVLAHAEAISHGERRREVVAAQRAESGTDAEQESISVQTLYELGKTEGISPEYVQKSLELLCPSREQRLADMREYSATPTRWQIEKLYGEDICDVLQRTLPEKKFELVLNPGYNFERFSVYCFSFQEKEERRFFRKRKKAFKKIWKNIVKGGYIEKNHIISINIYSPYFLRIYGKRLQELNEKFNPPLQLKITTDYPL